MVLIQKVNHMRFLISFFLVSIFFCSDLTDNDIKEMAKELNNKLQDVEIEDGMSFKKCFSLGRTLIWTYNVSDYWEPIDNMKEQIISNLKTAEDGSFFYNNKININYLYYRENQLLKKISIQSNELSNFSFELGEYLSIKGHPKSKDVNMKLKAPIGWKVEEGNRPNIVKKFTKDGNIYLIIIKENMTFFSRNEIVESFVDDDEINDFIVDATSFFENPEILDKSIVTIDTYPAIKFKIKVKMENSGITLPMVIIYWYVFYEDKLVLLQATSLDNAESRVLEPLYLLITNSVIFPDQYN